MYEYDDAAAEKAAEEEEAMFKAADEKDRKAKAYKIRGIDPKSLKQPTENYDYTKRT